MSGVKQVVFNDGEGVDYTDFNALQDYLLAQLHDYVEGNGAAGGNPAICYTRGGGGPYEGSANTVYNLTGLLYQYTSTAVDGLSAQLLVYNVAANELATTLSVGDATNPRIDGIFIKIEKPEDAPVNRDFKDATTGLITSESMVKTKTTTLTKVVVPGTPAATPATPATPAGYAPWAYVYVPQNHNAVYTLAGYHIRDARIPFGNVEVYAGPGDTLYEASSWDVTKFGLEANTSAALEEYHVIPPVPGGPYRLYDYDQNYPGFPPILGGDWEFWRVDPDQTVTVIVDAGVATGDIYRHNYLWSGGYLRQTTFAENGGSRLALRIGQTAATDYITQVYFNFSGGF